jgi:DNA-directed RNA polymerase specialized sigma24 family protein
MSSDDRRDIALCLDGHPEAFRLLVQRHQGSLVSYLRVRMGNWDRAAETAQESLVRAYFALSRLRKHESFLPWLIGIAERVACESSRAETRERLALSERGRIPAPATPPPDAALRAAVAGLPEPYREVVQMRYYGGLSCQEVAEALDLPLGTVTKRLSRAYVLLREDPALSAGVEEEEVHG